jgi:hypothetical protein
MARHCIPTASPTCVPIQKPGWNLSASDGNGKRRTVDTNILFDRAQQLQPVHARHVDGMLGQSTISLRGPNLTKPDIAAAIAKRPVCAELTIVRDTILSAFVSEAKFPASRESTGNFRYSGANGTKIAKRHV